MFCPEQLSRLSSIEGRNLYWSYNGHCGRSLMLVAVVAEKLDESVNGVA